MKAKTVYRCECGHLQARHRRGPRAGAGGCSECDCSDYRRATCPHGCGAVPPRPGPHHLNDCESFVPAPSSPSPKGETTCDYEHSVAVCTRCHAAAWVHHTPNIYTGRKDTRGHPYPEACDRFTPPALAAPTPTKEET
jgi:hypothetical protein